MKLWQKGTPTNKKIDQFTVGNDRSYDLILAPYDCIASKAHAQMLGKIGLLQTAEVAALVNALDALEEAGTCDPLGMKIEVSLEAANEGLLLTVRDNGPGVEESQLERVSDLFFTTKDVGRGSGLGLAIVHNTLEQHGGRGRLVSEPGRFFEGGLGFPGLSTSGSTPNGGAS